MSVVGRQELLTVGTLPAEDIVVLGSGTAWRVPWELMMLGPFVSCGLLDASDIRPHRLPITGRNGGPMITTTPIEPGREPPTTKEHTMSRSTSISTETDLQREVEEELKWDPAVTPASIGVSADGHAITLSGTVHHYGSRMAAVRAAKRVRGVHAIADDIVVEPAGTGGQTDHDIASFAEHAMTWSIEVPATVTATVRDGQVTLDGTVDWNFQRRAAARVVEQIGGVSNVVNNVTLVHSVSSKDVHQRIAEALRRSADIDASNVHVTSDGGHVHLTGSVASWAERDQAQHAAWSATGVTKVTDDLVIR